MQSEEGAGICFLSPSLLKSYQIARHEGNADTDKSPFLQIPEKARFTLKRHSRLRVTKGVVRFFGKGEFPDTGEKKRGEGPIIFFTSTPSFDSRTLERPRWTARP